MPQTLSVATALEKNRLDSDIPFLVALDIEVVNPDTGVVVEVLHVVRNDSSIIHGGNTYEPAIFDIAFGSEAGSQSQINLHITDYTGAVQGRMEEYGGGVGFNVTMYILNSAALASPPEVVEFFQVIGAVAQEYRAQFTLGAENEAIRTFPRRRQTRDFCQWRYRDADTCGYSGGLATCDLTLQGPNGCAAHNNTGNFGAYPGLNSNGYRYA